MTVQDGMDHVRVLVDEIGKRPTGFEGERRAARYLCEVLEGWGLRDVGTESFDARSWDFSDCRLEAEWGIIDALPVEFSGSTSDGGVKGELLVCEDMKDIRAAEVAGKIVLAIGEPPEGDDVLRGKAAGLILTEGRILRPYHAIYGPTQPLADKLPMVTIAFQDAVELVRRQTQSVRLSVRTTVREVKGLNVVGVVPAAGGSNDRRLNISAHYDSVPAGGAADNATGTACALEVVHALSQIPLPAAVDIALFSGEEVGLYGSAAYAERHRDELARTELGIYFDGQGDILARHRIHVIGRSGLVEFVRRTSDAVGYRVGIGYHVTTLDNVFLSGQGVPTLWFQRTPQPTWHTREDVSAHISPKALRETICCAAEIARRVALDPGAFPAGIPEDQMAEVKKHVARGVPNW